MGIEKSVCVCVIIHEKSVCMCEYIHRFTYDKYMYMKD